MQFRKLTPVLDVDAIEPLLPFWVDRLGFELTAAVPEGGEPLAFALLSSGTVEVMLQTRRSLAEDLKEAAPGKAQLYLEVSDIDAVARALEGTEIAIPRRTTFYGATEIGVRLPGSHLLIFAQQETHPA